MACSAASALGLVAEVVLLCAPFFDEFDWTPMTADGGERMLCAEELESLSGVAPGEGMSMAREVLLPASLLILSPALLSEEESFEWLLSESIGVGDLWYWSCRKGVKGEKRMGKHREMEPREGG